MGSFDDLLAQSKETELELVTPLHIAEPPYGGAAEKLATESVMEVRARRLQGGLPYAFTVISVPAEVGRRLSRVRLLRTVGARWRTAILELLDGLLEPPIVLARQDITVDVAPAEVADLIDVPPQVPVLRIDRVYFDQNDAPVEYEVNYLNPQRYSYRLEMKRTP